MKKVTLYPVIASCQARIQSHRVEFHVYLSKSNIFFLEFSLMIEQAVDELSLSSNIHNSHKGGPRRGIISIVNK